MELARGDGDAAIAALRKEIALQPRVPEVYVVMARTHLNAGRLPAAVDTLNDMWVKVPGLERKRLDYWRLIASLALQGEAMKALCLLIAAHEPGECGREIGYLVAARLLNEGCKDSTAKDRGIRAAELCDLLEAAHVIFAEAGNWPMALAVAEIEVLAVPDAAGAHRRSRAQLRLAESHAHAGNHWMALRVLLYVQQFLAKSSLLGSAARRTSRIAEKHGDLAAAIECAEIWSQTWPALEHIREHIDCLKARLTRPGTTSE
jgi:tetratricopeptide (TPR) repeat protein